MSDPGSLENDAGAVSWLRQVTPYFRRHRGQTMVVYLADVAVGDAGFLNRVRDLSLLSAVGVKLIVVYGARQQIQQRLDSAGIKPPQIGAARVTDADSMTIVREVVGALRFELEAAFSFGLDNTLSGGGHTVASGNYVTAKPAGVVDGVDLKFTGHVRSINRSLIENRLDEGAIVLVPPLGYSPTGELFNLKANELAAAIASELAAAKLIMISATDGIHDSADEVQGQMTLREAHDLLHGDTLEPAVRELLTTAVAACQHGVARVHLLGKSDDGAILRELFTRDGVGTLLSSQPFDQLRQAHADDAAGIVDLVAPLEADGILVKRSREKLENEIEHFVVMVREDTVVACGALYPFSNEHSGEIACIAVHPDYRGSEFGDLLLNALEQRAGALNFEQVFVLTTQAAQWFSERGFQAAELAALPVERQRLYNFQRNSKVMLKSLKHK